MALQIKDDNFKEITSNGKPTVIDFWAVWCGPCKRMAPIIEQLAQEYEGQVNIGKCDVEEAEDLATEFHVTSIPTIVFLNEKGEEVNRLVGALPKPKVEENIKALL